MKSDVSDPMARNVAEFFEDPELQSKMMDMKRMIRRMDQRAADILNARVAGDTLAIGGVWEFFEWRPQLGSLTVLDLSESMMKSYAPEGARTVVGDLYREEFPEGSLDSVVFPLILHHVADGNWARCESRVQEALARAHRWLKPGGSIYILECCPAAAWYPLQRALLPVTKRFLRRFHQPLVVMHTRQFYEQSLRKLYDGVEPLPVLPEGRDRWMWYPLFLSVPWIRLPFFLGPKHHIFVGSKSLP